MLPRIHRVDKDLGQEIFTKGKVFHGDFLYLKVYSKPGLARFSVVIPKKVARSAVVRNKFKRRINAVLSSLIIRISPNVVGLFFAKKNISEASFKELYRDIENILKKALVFK